MALEVIGNTSGVIVGSGEEASAPFHVVTHPIAGNTYRLSAFTGTIGAALAANSELFQFRFVSGTKSFAVVTKVIFDGLATMVVATAAGPVGFKLVPARAWTAAGSGGTRLTTSGDNCNLETSAPASQVNDVGISTTGALTAGTKTKDSTAIGQAIVAAGTAAITAYTTYGVPSQPLLDAAAGNLPLVLANQEGFTIDTTHTGPSAMTYVAGFTVEWAEVTAW